MSNPINEPENQEMIVTPNPYTFEPGFKCVRQPQQRYASKTRFRAVALMINRPTQCSIRLLNIYPNFCQIIVRYRANTKYRFSCQYNVLINRADVIDPFIWDTEDPKEFIAELMTDLSQRKELLKGQVKQEHPFVTVTERYYVRPPDSINNHSVAVFTCKDLPEIQFKLTKTLDASPPFYELRTMENQIIPVYNHDRWSGIIPSKCISWHKAFRVARSYAVHYWHKAHPPK